MVVSWGSEMVTQQVGWKVVWSEMQKVDQLAQQSVVGWAGDWSDEMVASMVSELEIQGTDGKAWMET